MYVHLDGKEFNSCIVVRIVLISHLINNLLTLSQQLPIEHASHFHFVKMWAVFALDGVSIHNILTPGVELIANNGFETGDLTSWDLL